MDRKKITKKFRKSLKKLKKANWLQLSYHLLVIVLVLVAAGTAITVMRAPGGLQLFVVRSGSMAPKIKPGALVASLQRPEYKVNDVIVYLTSPGADLRNPDSTITHRVIEVHDDEGRATFTTKGDANQTADQEMVPEVRVLGKVFLNIPYLGYLINFTKSQTGFIVLILIPGTIIVYTELIKLKTEIVRVVKNRKKSNKKKKK